ncbi:helicase-related protein [Saccharopolyspora shandongensis]|uniref:helicase-related protein n=1 Tax=Saccharopolyspora shandongensis TaxID=418495 RepID=UPI0033DA9158
MSTPASNAGREDIIKALREELIGPAPAGKPLTSFTFATKEDSYGPWVSARTGEEILERKPLVRYGVGVLFPASSTNTPEITDQTVVPGLAAENGDDRGQARTGTWQGPEEGLRDSSDDADFELSGANERRPTAMGVSFLLTAEPEGRLKVEVTGGRYSPVQVEVPGKTRRTTLTWWERTPVKAVWHVGAAHSQQGAHVHRNLEPVEAESAGLEGLRLRLTVNFRRHSSGTLTTVALVNRSDSGSKAMDSRCLFQSEMTVTPENAWIEPYPEASAAGAHDDDESFRLIYRHAQTYAVGHGCSANWGDADPKGRSWWVTADPLPAYETPSITPDIELDDGTPLTVSMAQLAGLEPGGMAQLERVLAEYERWIGKRKAEAAGLDSRFRITADRHMIECTRALERMRQGLKMVRDPESDEGRAFRLANEAMLKQQVRSSAKRRTTEIVDGRNTVSGTQPDEAAAAKAGRGRWRAFQIAFLLAAIPSTSDSAHEDREAVDLIFFPTGGGKTEAYLGLSAFAMLLRRLRDPNDVGVTVLMRYTLRLLTAQQFLRAAGLVCALDRIWEREYGAASERFSIGIWVGGETTPNWQVKAKTALNRLANGDEKNPFLLLRCPWCAAQMGPVKSVGNSGRATGGQNRRGRGRSSNNASGTGTAGYELKNERVVFVCPDQECDFSTPDRPLPVYVVDEDLYRHRPSMVIGTVDKFAQLAWNPNVRALFGIGDSGERQWSPPELVIQDELHLIAGPLGSMTGLYEGLIEDLCTDHRGGRSVLPKIVASTATIRRHEEQVQALYARGTVHLFPPHGIDASDSFFAVYARDRQTGELLPGRKYIGVHAPALGSMQTTQVRSFAALLQAAKDAGEERRDPWWTLMAFFNSLRELGNSLSLMQSDIPDYLKTINNRSSSDRTALRYLNQVEEMTSRLRQDEIPEAMEKLEKTVQDGNAIDVCLASSLIEVGIDINRLSLMAVVGQPKSTSQYIQVTGRVGRKWDERPGLVLTLYGAGKPRDRSHFERFRTYHQRLYAQVEPTSATPFAPSAVDRALHAVVVAYIRQRSDRSMKPYPFPDDYFSQAEELIRARVAICDPKEKGRVDSVLDRLRTEWQNWQPSEWGTAGGSAEQGDLLRVAGQYAQPDIEQSTWPTPSSMRGVDAECRTEITPRYAIDGGKQK